VDRELSLRDYGRVLWSGRWLIVATAVAAAIVGLIVGLVRTTQYTATARVSLGQITTLSGVPVQTPDTSPATAPDILRSDAVIEQVAERSGVDEDMVRDGVTVTTPRTPGAQAANQPTVARITFVSDSRSEAQEVVNTYADVVAEQAQARVEAVQGLLERRVAELRAEAEGFDDRIEAAEAGLRRAGGETERAAWQSLLFAALEGRSRTREDLSLQQLTLERSRQIESPRPVSKSSGISSSGSIGSRARTVLFGLVIGLILGIVITFVWRGSPARRAGE
jgi:uncharacterized protein involved in exopolysaccharide biosynthesis